MEVTIGEIIENIRLENINIEVIVGYADNKIADIVFNGFNDASGYQMAASELGFDVYKKVNISNVDHYVERIVDVLRNDIMNYQSENRERILKEKIKDVEMNVYGWE